jgi:plasmid stabilization system protein ParE
LSNPSRQRINTLVKITRHIRQLERFPEIGAPLSSIERLDSLYRFLVCHHYLAFYRLEKESVFIDRILYDKTNYLAILFGDATQENEQENEPS